ncbi:ribonuclease H-like domain-containing protein [Tanacetum coccineum]
MTARLAILNLGDYDLWLMRIEQYFLKTDYSLWEVIKNGNKVLRRTVETVEQVYEPTTVEEKQDRRNEMKARATLLMALPNKDQLKFHSYQDAKLLIEAIEKRYGGNKESKKVQRTFLKQQYENFATLSSEIMDQTFDRVQKLIGQLEIQGEVINQEDMNLKLLRKDLEQLHPDDLEEMIFKWNGSWQTNKQEGLSREHERSQAINRQRGYDWSYQAEEEQPTNHALMAFTSLGSSSSSDSEIKDIIQFPHLYQGISYLRKPDLTFMDEIVKSENLDVTTVVTPCNVKTVENKGVSNTVEANVVRMNTTSAPIIEDWNSDDESEIDYTVRPSTEKIKSVKTVRETDAPKQNKNNPRGNQRNWNNLMSQRLGILTRSGKFNTVGASVNTAVRPVNIAGSKPTVNHPRSITNAFKKGYSQDIRPFNKYLANQNSIFNKKVNTDRVKGTTAMDRAVVSENKGKRVNVVKASAYAGFGTKEVGNPQQKEYKEKSYRQTHLQRRKKKKGVIDRGFGHINFKNINKLVKGNLVRGLTSKIFENIILVLLVRKESNTKPPGIKREFSVARTPQQNGVAERRNKTLIETARTITPVSAAGPSFTNDDPSSLDEVLEADLTTWKTNYECQSLFHNQIERDIPKDQIIRDL